MTPPETGASMFRWPAASASSCACRASSTAIVEHSTKSVPGAAIARRPASPLPSPLPLYALMTCRPTGSIVMTTRAPATASAAVAAIGTPASRACATASADRSNPRTSTPARARFAAIGAPMCPSPMNATGPAAAAPPAAPSTPPDALSLVMMPPTPPCRI